MGGAQQESLPPIMTLVVQSSLLASVKEIQRQPPKPKRMVMQLCLTRTPMPAPSPSRWELWLPALFDEQQERFTVTFERS